VIVSRVIFSEHALWRAGERHRESVCVERFEHEIADAIAAGWVTSHNPPLKTVLTRSGHRFVIHVDGETVRVVTSLGREG
jgi:hypothetical protein